jgi:hypothetical protein
VFEGPIAQPLVVELIDSGCEAESPFPGRVPR